MSYWRITKERSLSTIALLLLASALLLLTFWQSPYRMQRLHNSMPGTLQVVDGAGQVAGAAAEPAVLLLNADALVATINGGVINLAARVRDAEGKAVPGVTVHFSSAQGTVSPANAVTGADGVATAIFTGGNREGQALVKVEVGGLVREAAVQLVTPNHNATAHTLSLQPASLALDLGQEIHVTGILRDGAGKPLAGDVVAIFGSLGQVTPSSAVTDDAGRIAFTYRAGNAPGSAMITLLAGYASTSVTLQVGKASGALDQRQFLPEVVRQ